MKPSISVIIPCYNQSQFLPEAVESVLNADYPKIEIIIVNDGSTDNSKEVAEKLTDKYPNVSILNQKNSGVMSARNAGIEFASGKYILPLDGDDIIMPNYIQDAISIMETQQHVKVVYCEAVKFDETGERPWNLKPYSPNLLARDNMIFVSGIYRKSDAIAIGGYDENMSMGRADWEFWISMLKDGGQVIRLPYVGFKYRLTKGESLRKKTGSKEMKKKRIAYLNSKHSDFFERELNGPLRYQRTLSRPINTILKFIGKL